jgi:hypothetical protein
MRSTLIPSLRLNRWVTWIVGAAGAELCWFALLHPLVPITMRAGVVEALLPLLIVGYIYLVVRALLWLADAPLSMALRRLVALLLVLSVGLAVFAIVYTAQQLLSNEFGR